MKSFFKGVFVVLLVCGLIGIAAWLDIRQTVAQTFPNPTAEPIPVAIGIVFTAPEECKIGELVRLDATSSDVSDFEWSIIPETPDFEVVEAERRGFFSARTPGLYLISIAGAKGGQAFLSHHTLKVTAPDRSDDVVEPKLETVPPIERDWKELTDALERFET